MGPNRSDRLGNRKFGSFWGGDYCKMKFVTGGLEICHSYLGNGVLDTRAVYQEIYGYCKLMILSTQS
jgi:hypothetical protein